MERRECFERRGEEGFCVIGWDVVVVLLEGEEKDEVEEEEGEFVQWEEEEGEAEVEARPR